MEVVTTATRKPPVRPDLSYLRRTPSYRENPDLLDTAVEHGGLAFCSKCHRVVGVGANVEMAESHGLREGTAVRVGTELRCQDHA